MQFRLHTFTNAPSATKEELLTMADYKFHSVDTDTGEEIFAIDPATARWLLHCCEHNTPVVSDTRRIAMLAYEYRTVGASKSWPKKPVVINTTSCKIEDGVARLYAIAHSKGVCMPIRFVD